MLEDQIKVAKAFWTNQTLYPEYPYIKERRFLEIKYILKHLGDAKSLLDYGCGDGSMLLLLRELSDLKELYGMDLSDNLIKIAKEKLGGSAYICTYDFNNGEEIPWDTDITISLGVIPYLFEDKKVEQYLSTTLSSKLILRVSCGLEERISINKYSDDLKSQYAAVYRTPKEVYQLLDKYFTITDIDRAYPDEIESKYGTKHFFFVGNRK